MIRRNCFITRAKLQLYRQLYKRFATNNHEFISYPSKGEEQITIPPFGYGKALAYLGHFHRKIAHSDIGLIYLAALEEFSVIGEHFVNEKDPPWEVWNIALSQKQLGVLVQINQPISACYRKKSLPLEQSSIGFINVAIEIAASHRDILTTCFRGKETENIGTGRQHIDRLDLYLSSKWLLF